MNTKGYSSSDFEFIDRVGMNEKEGKRSEDASSYSDGKDDHEVDEGSLEALEPEDPTSESSSNQYKEGGKMTVDAEEQGEEGDEEEEEEEEGEGEEGEDEAEEEEEEQDVIDEKIRREINGTEKGEMGASGWETWREEESSTTAHQNEGVEKKTDMTNEINQELEGNPCDHRSREIHQEDMFDAKAEASRVAQGMLGKLNSAMDMGIKSLGQLSVNPPAAGNLSKLAEGLTSGLGGWWGGGFASESEPRKPKITLTPQPPSESSKVVQLFGLHDDEQLVEQFPCKLLQTYGCRHNNFTPSLQMAFQGHLYLTDRHLCFSVEERGKQLPVKVPLSEVTQASRQLPSQRGAGDSLRVELKQTREGDAHFTVFKDFESGGALDSALALLEHLTDSS